MQMNTAKIYLRKSASICGYFDDAQYKLLSRGCLRVMFCLLLPIIAFVAVGCALGQGPSAAQWLTPISPPAATAELPPPLIFAASATLKPSATPEMALTVPVAATPTANGTPLTPSTLTQTPQSATPELSPTAVLSPTATVSSTLSSPSPTAVVSSISPTIVPVGRSVQGRPIETYRLNHGSRHVVLVGGIHGGYEWNSILLAYETLDYLLTNPDLIPPEITLHIIPSANPDGQFRVTQQDQRFSPSDVSADTIPGRFNANEVDLNRNWDCQWSPTALWRDTPVQGGTAPFSEPESEALRDYCLTYLPEVVVFLHSAANGVFASGCPDPHQPSLELATVYAQAAGYPVYERFDAYPITGDAGDWLTAQGIASFTVELRNHSDTDWPQNREGLLALLNYIADNDTSD